MTDLNPHAKQMADESMVRNLEAQARAIWPQEVDLILNYGLSEWENPNDPPSARSALRILDAGCGTGEISSRLADLFPHAHVLGVDIIDAHLELARERCAQYGPRLQFGHQSIYDLAAHDGTYDLTLCRHVLHSIPHADRAIAELVRVTRPGGWVHLVPEDYGMLHFQPGGLDIRAFWHETPARYAAATGTDLFVGRNAYSILVDLGLTDIRVSYVTVDTVRVERETFARIIEAWRDGYAESISELATMSRDQVTAHFDQMIADIRNPRRYAVWMVPVVAGCVPKR